MKSTGKDVIVTVTNISLNCTEYKSIKDFSYNDFCEWIWISCNYTPFMTLAVKNNFEYADGGLGVIVPIEQAILKGAEKVDVIILSSKIELTNRMKSRNQFSLLTNIFGFILDKIEKQNIKIGKLTAEKQDSKINFYYTPTHLTSNSLIFDKRQMTEWWDDGYQFAKNKHEK